ncbi:MAG: conserved membrane protein of unknown function [Candidatus Thorarchaeota archaeon]|nr:MAG: conserved membrane protein of unknown function [Candidatus Thorarchaeota archaeon]
MSVTKSKLSYALVVFTWLFFLLGAALVFILILSILFISNTTSTFLGGLQVIQQAPYLLIYVEIASAGLFPLVYSLYKKEPPRVYGIQKKNSVLSIIISISLLMILDVVESLVTGNPIFSMGESYNLPLGFGVFYAALGLFAYGPLEVFFIFWLIVKTDDLFKKKILFRIDLDANKSIFITKGTLISCILFGLIHVITTQYFPSFFLIMLVFLLLGIIFTNLENSIGPMLAWSIYNNQVLSVVTSCLF